MEHEMSNIKVAHNNSMTNETFGDVSPSTSAAKPPKDPRPKYNIISWLCFLWLEPLLWLGLRKGIKMDDLDLYPHPPEADSEKLLKRFNRLWKVELLRKKNRKKPRLLLTMLRCFLWKFLLQGLIFFIEVCLLISMSVIVGNITENLAISNLSDEETRNSYLFALGLVFCGLCLAFIRSHGYLLAFKLGMMARITMTAVIYQKVTSLSQVTIGRLSIGRIVNLASNDVQRFDLAFAYAHIFWIAPIHLSVATYLVYLEIGYSCFIMTGFILIQVPLLIVLAKIFTRLRLKSAPVTDKRIKIMNEIISGIKVIKLYAWEYAFKAVVQKLRRLESIIIFQSGLVRAISLSFVITSITLVSFITFSVYTGTGGVLTPRKVFTVLSLFNGLNVISVYELVQNTLSMSEGQVALTRIQQLLDVEDLNLDNDITNEMSSDDVSVTVDNVSASWTCDATNKVLDGVSFKVTKESQLLSVVGPVGAGKSTLLQCLLRELRPMSGTVKMNGILSYTSQEPWLFSASLRDNILFGNPYDPDRYKKVIEACALVKDIKQLVDGDMTIVGERGVTLSGGQKARVSLARAVYHHADIYLLDDPLSAVDTVVAKHLFDKCIRGILKDKLVVLVTHQVQFALQCDQVLGLNEGRIELYGEVNDLLAKDVNLKCFLGILESEGKNEKINLNSNTFIVPDDSGAAGVQRQGATPGPMDSPDVTCVKLPGFHNQTDMLSSLFIDDCSSMLDCKKPQSDGKFNSTTTVTSYCLAESGDRYLPRVELKQSKSIASSPSLYSVHSETVSQEDKLEEYLQTITLPSEETSHGSLSLKTYYEFFRAGGSVLALLLMVIVFVMGQVSILIADWWISDWSQCSQMNETNSENRSTCLLSIEERIGIFGGVTAATVILNVARTVSFYAICINASRVLHNRMFRSVLRSPMLFFDTNPIGRVLNRFAKDVGFLDDLLPYIFLEYLLWLTRVSSFLMIALVSIPWLIFPFALLLVLLLAIRFYYCKTSREIKRLEAIARSPVYSHISTTLQGLPIIRSFRKKNVALDQFHDYQNNHTKSYYLYIALARWLGVKMDFLSAVMLGVVVFSAVPLSTVFDAALIGLALTYSVAVTDLCQFTVRLGAEVENIMISGERIMEYSRLDQEASLETQSDESKPAVDWPMEGKIEMDNVTFQYSSKLPLVLNHLTFTVHPGEKVGVVGRTGAGKSSLLSVLFRLAEPHGQIIIDGVDIQRIGLHDLRSKISIIPQDPVLFSGTMRYNLDPFEKFSDSYLWDVLEQVQLKVAVEQLEGQLSGEVSEGGSNFSVGQKQLVCLARALLRKNKILILDEATANVDVGTDAIIQQMIREMFSKCTIITIAHRLNTIMDSDRILVLSNGLIKEFDTPHNLLRDSNSLFVEMVEQTESNRQDLQQQGN